MLQAFPTAQASDMPVSEIECSRVFAPLCLFVKEQALEICSQVVVSRALCSMA